MFKYNIFRWYRPSFGRYTSADPISWSLRKAQSVGDLPVLADTEFSYAVNSPLSYADPLGLAPCGPNPANVKMPCVQKCGAQRDYALCQFNGYSKITDNLDFIGLAMGAAAVLVAPSASAKVVAVGGAALLWFAGKEMSSALPAWFKQKVQNDYEHCLDTCALYACKQLSPFSPEEPSL